MKITFSPPFLYKLFIELMLLTLLLPIRAQIIFPFNLFGLALFIAGSFVAIATKKMFKRTQTPITHHAAPTKLHIDGIFRITRNPMYLGITIGLAGIAILTGIVYNLLFSIIYIAIMDIYFVRAEEKELEKRI